MSSRLPMVKQTAWISLIPHIIIMGLMVLIWHQFNPRKSIMFGTMTYLALSYTLRYSIPLSHRKGINSVNNEQYSQAIEEFESSYKFFSKNKWLDKYRYITMLNSSKMTYREMALANIAFCYSQDGNGKLSKQYYERTLDEFPNNRLAKAGLNMINTISQEENN